MTVFVVMRYACGVVDDAEPIVVLPDKHSMMCWVTDQRDKDEKEGEDNEYYYEEVPMIEKIDV